MFKIGDFSRISQVPVSALRYYDEVGLLRPARIDEWTSYRYYTAQQLPRVNRIVALKDLGFSLEEVKRLLDENLPVEELRGMLRLRQSQVRAAMEEEKSRLARVELRLQQIETEGKMSGYEVIMKRVEPMAVAYASGEVGGRKLSTFAGAVAAEGELVSEIGQVCDVIAARLRRLLADTGARENGPWFLMVDQRDDDIDLQMVTPIERIPPYKGELEEGAGFKRLDGAEQMACVVHRGGYDTLLQAYASLGRWIEANGYRMAGACREVYVYHDANHEMGSQPSHVVEVQFPVDRV